MATSTILRVKRRLEENPQDAFVITCKRQRTNVVELSPALFVFSGTVKIQDPRDVSAKNFVPKETPKLKLETNVSDIIQKIREEKKGKATEHRYEVVKCSRGLNDIDNDMNNEDYTFVDLAKKVKEEKDAQYAYDLYVAAVEDFDVAMLDDLVSIENYESDLILGSFRDNGRRTPSSGADSSDDSNDENNWRNDYPDEENSSIDEDDMVKAMERCDLAELSSDEGEDDIYSQPVTINPDDVQRYGAAYAKYKARVLNQETDLSNSNNFVHCTTIRDLDEDSIEGYKGSSDEEGFYYGQEQDTDHFRQQYKTTSSSDEDPD